MVKKQFPVSMMSLILRTIENVKNVQYKKFMQLWNQSNLISNDFACLQTVRYWEENIGHKAYQRISPHCDPINLRCRIQHSGFNRLILSKKMSLIFYSRIWINIHHSICRSGSWLGYQWQMRKIISIKNCLMKLNLIHGFRR